MKYYYVSVALKDRNGYYSDKTYTYRATSQYDIGTFVRVPTRCGEMLGRVEKCTRDYVEKSHIQYKFVIGPAEASDANT